MSYLALAIRRLREKRGISQEELAELVGVRQGTISGLERDAARRVDLDTIGKLADALGVHPCDLLEWTPSRKRSR